MKSLRLLFAVLVSHQVFCANAFGTSAREVDAVAQRIVDESDLPLSGDVVVDPYRSAGVASISYFPGRRATIFVHPEVLREATANSWAFIIGHELCHEIFQTSDESLCDREGAKLAIRAGFDADEFIEYTLAQPNYCSRSHGCLHDRAYDVAKVAAEMGVLGPDLSARFKLNRVSSRSTPSLLGPAIPLTVHNNTKYPLKLSLRYNASSGQEDCGDWENSDFRSSWGYDAGEKARPNYAGNPILASRFEYYATIEDWKGQVWSWGSKDVPTCCNLTDFQGEVYTLEFQANNVPPPPSRKYVQITNATETPIRVYLAYYTRSDDGSWGWHNSEFKSSWSFEPGESATIRHDDFKVNAYKVRYYAWEEGGDGAWGSKGTPKEKVIGSEDTTGVEEDNYVLRFVD